MIKKKYYEDSLNESVDGILDEIIQDKGDIIITEDSDILENIIDMDITDNMPPQMYAVISGVLKLIEDIEDVENENR